MAMEELQMNLIRPRKQDRQKSHSAGRGAFGEFVTDDDCIDHYYYYNITLSASTPYRVATPIAATRSSYRIAGILLTSWQRRRG